ncbi:MAG: BofC C-terminal domain-containing protein [Clostridia bacterium]|nr:BofC C-terminal domain-containing protein [Clostridia bacterium]
MNKKLYYTICSAVIGVFLIVWSAAFVYCSIKFKPSEMQKPQPEVTKSEITENSAIQNISTKEDNFVENYYLIVCENDVLTVYEVKNGEKTFTETLDINVSQMRKSDKEEFMRGVKVNSKIELAHIIEDYAS